MNDLDFLPDAIQVETQAPAAEKIKPRHPSAPKNTPVARLLEQKALNPNLSIRQLAKINSVSAASVSEMFKRYGINKEFLESFKKNRADIFAGIQETALSTLTVDDIKKASVRDRTILIGTLYDKERLEKGGQDANQVTILFQVVQAACESRTAGAVIDIGKGSTLDEQSSG